MTVTVPTHSSGEDSNSDSDSWIEVRTATKVTLSREWSRAFHSSWPIDNSRSYVEEKHSGLVCRACNRSSLYRVI
jgi:hypothetical protein